MSKEMNVLNFVSHYFVLLNEIVKIKRHVFNLVSMFVLGDCRFKMFGVASHIFSLLTPFYSYLSLD